MHVRSGHLHLGTLIGRSGGCVAALVGSHLSGEAILGKLSGIRTFWAEELVDVVSENVGIGQQRVIRSVVLSSSLDHSVRVLQMALDRLQLAQSLRGLPGLCEEGILDDTGVAIQ